MKVIKKSVHGPIEIIETNKQYFMDCTRSLIGADVTMERVYLDGYEFIMVVGEDGLYKELPLNFFMEFPNNPHFPVQAIVGDVYFIRNKKLPDNAGEIWDWEVTDVTEKDMAFLEHILDNGKQARLASLFGRLYNTRWY